MRVHASHPQPQLTRRVITYEKQPNTIRPLKPLWVVLGVLALVIGIALAGLGAYLYLRKQKRDAKNLEINQERLDVKEGELSSLRNVESHRDRRGSSGVFAISSNNTNNHNRGRRGSNDLAPPSASGGGGGEGGPRSGSRTREHQHERHPSLTVPPQSPGSPHRGAELVTTTSNGSHTGHAGSAVSPTSPERPAGIHIGRAI